MTIGPAAPEDVVGLAHLLWLDDHENEPTEAAVRAFAAELEAWWSLHHETHRAFVARSADGQVVGMAWIALVPRVPRPGALGRLAGEVQTVFVLPAHRGRGLGSALVDAAARHAEERGASRVTVHSGRRAVPVYERLGFTSSRRLLQRPSD